MSIGGNKISGAFQRDYRSAKTESSKSKKKFVVLRVKKDGNTCSIKSANVQLDYFNKREDAEKRKEEKENLNPTMNFIVVDTA